MYQRKLINHLRRWKQSAARKPLILRGARQVGKTSLVKMFSSEFDYFICLNLDKKEDKEIFERNDDIKVILQILLLRENISPEPERTLLVFIDEIQNSPQAVKLLRYFYEQAPEVHVIAAGSLLESIFDHQISFPVGRVEYLILRPFSFEEYLLAKGEEAALAAYHTIPMPSYAHDKLLALFVEYCLVGGMPEVVKSYIATHDIVAAGRIFESLIASYMEDVEKYAQTLNQIRIIRHIICHAFKRVNERIKFEGFGESHYRSKDVGECFRILEKTFLLSLVYPTTSTSIPIAENYRKSPKLQLLDTGIINKMAGVQFQILNNDLIDNVFEGKVAEHIVGQELLASQESVLARNCFWVKEKNQSNAEVDYVLQLRDRLVPIEVKLGKTGRLRSLMEFVDGAPHDSAIRVYSGHLHIERVKTLRGKEFHLLNLPFYLVGHLPEYFESMCGLQERDPSWKA
jgi:predicted AAA+ superfamily ATPase